MADEKADKGKADKTDKSDKGKSDKGKGSTSVSKREPSFWEAQTGWKSWAFTLDHKRLGIMYLVSTMLFFMVGGLAAILFRTELLTPQGDFLPWLNMQISGLFGDPGQHRRGGRDERHDLQQAVHRPRGGDGLLGHHPVGARRTRQLLVAADARGQGRRLPRGSTCCRTGSTPSARASSCTRCSRAASTPAGRSTPRTPRARARRSSPPRWARSSWGSRRS